MQEQNPTVQRLMQDLDTIVQIETQLDTRFRANSGRVADELGDFDAAGHPMPSPSKPVTWKGADVIITRYPLPDYKGSSTVVVSPHAQSIAGLLHKFANQLLSLSYLAKLEFYGRIADRLNDTASSEQTRKEALSLIIAEARAVLGDWIARVLDTARNH